MDYIKELMIKAEDEANDLLLAELLMRLALEEELDENK